MQKKITVLSKTDPKYSMFSTYDYLYEPGSGPDTGTEFVYHIDAEQKSNHAMAKKLGIPVDEKTNTLIPGEYTVTYPQPRSTNRP